MSAAHTRLLVEVGAMGSYSLAVHVVSAAHTRLLVEVGATASYSLAVAVHVVSAAHTRLLFEVGATGSYSLAVHVVSAAHTRLLVEVGAMAWNSFVKSHVVTTARRFAKHFIPRPQALLTFSTAEGINASQLCFILVVGSFFKGAVFSKELTLADGWKNKAENRRLDRASPAVHLTK
jgi:hypothetical protein